MTVTDWLADVQTATERFGIRGGVRAGALSLWQGVCHRLGSACPPLGTSIWACDWDVLVVLDACRPDALEAVAPEYDWLPNVVDVKYSRASCSRRWMQANFGRGRQVDIAGTAYITANPWTRDFGADGILPPHAFSYLDEVWRDGWDDDRGTATPRAVTDRAIPYWRESEHTNQLIIHYMQPHAPYVGFGEGGEVSDEGIDRRVTVRDRLQAGEVAPDEAWDAYLDTLRWVLDDVTLLRENLDADRLAITADHGELFGEAGLYGHPDVPLSTLRRVPWVETKGDDERTYSPGTSPPSPERDVDASVDERLTALGYQ